jgi:hypothetical protein
MEIIHFPAGVGFVGAGVPEARQLVLAATATPGKNETAALAFPVLRRKSGKY